MKPFLNILVGIDESPASAQALAMAESIAAKEGAKVTAWHVIPLPDLSDFIEFYRIEHKTMLQDARQNLRDFVEQVLGPDHGVTCEVSEGSPHHELVSIANEGHYDLLIVGNGDEDTKPGNSGRFGIRCLRFSDMPVLIVNQVPDPGLPVAACLDFSKSTEPILEHIARINPDPSPPLHLVHACRPPWLHGSFHLPRRKAPEGSGEKERFREVIDASLSVIRDKAAEQTGSAAEIICLEDRHPNRALLDHLTETSYRLVVIGRSGKGFKGLVTDVIGGTAESLIRHATSPILIVPLSSE